MAAYSTDECLLPIANRILQETTSDDVPSYVVAWHDFTTCFTCFRRTNAIVHVVSIICNLIHFLAGSVFMSMCNASSLVVGLTKTNLEAFGKLFMLHRVSNIDDDVELFGPLYESPDYSVVLLLSRLYCPISNFRFVDVLWWSITATYSACCFL